MKPTSTTYILRMATALAVASLLACGAQEEAAMSGKGPLLIGSASAGSAFPTSRAATRPLDDPNDAIGLFLAKANGYTEPVNNRRYAYGTPFWLTDEQQLLLGSESATLAAYNPYSDQQSKPEKLLTSQVYDATKEFYYLPFTAAYINTSVNLNLRRAYALIRFSIIRGETNKPNPGDGAYQGTGSVSALSFSANLIASGTLDLFTGGITGAPSTPLTCTFPASGVPFDIGSADTPAQKDYLIVPVASYTGELTFTAMIDGREMKGKVESSALCGSGGLVEGVMYEIRVHVRPTKLEVSHVYAVTDWKETSVDDELGNM